VWTVSSLRTTQLCRSPKDIDQGGQHGGVCDENVVLESRREASCLLFVHSLQLCLGEGMSGGETLRGVCHDRKLQKHPGTLISKQMIDEAIGDGPPSPRRPRESHRQQDPGNDRDLCYFGKCLLYIIGRYPIEALGSGSSGKLVVMVYVGCVHGEAMDSHGNDDSDDQRCELKEVKNSVIGNPLLKSKSRKILTVSVYHSLLLLS
jgi:hypothetical protein